MALPQEVEGWGLQDQIEELRGKFHLLKKDQESYLENSEIDIHMNEQVISSLRRSNKAKRIMLAEHENGDERVIQEVFKDNRTEKLSLQRFTATEALEHIDQTVSEKGNFLNALRYQKEKREQKMKELDQELQRMYLMEKKNPETQESEQTATQLENGLDKALIKYDTAKIITTRYEDILSKVKEESLCLPAKLDCMEQALRQQKADLRELRAMHREAVSSRDKAKSELAIVEQIVYESRKTREAELSSTRKEVERRRVEAEKVDKKAARATLISDQTDQKALLETQMKLEKQNRILLYEDMMERIKMASHVSDIENVVEQFEAQKETGSRLKGRVQELEGVTNRLKSEATKLQKEFHDMKYNGEQKLSSGQARLEEMTDFTQQEDTKLTKTRDMLERNGDILTNVRTGVTTLMKKLECVKLSPPNHNHTDGDVYDQLDLCSKKIQHLTRDLDSGPANLPLPAQLQDTDFHHFLETEMSPDNIRVKLEVSETDMSEFDFDEQDNEVLSRTDIKNIGQKLIDSKQKQKPKKRKGKKK